MDRPPGSSGRPDPRLQDASADDEPASLVIACWAEGLIGPEIRRRLGITDRQLVTTKVRIRRIARRTKANEPR